MAESFHPSQDRVPLLPEGGRFEGLVAIGGDARIEGAVDGEIVARGRLEVGEKAQIRARVEAEEVVLEGCLEGEVRARHRVELGPRARLVGVLTTARLVIADGGCFDGRLEMDPASRGPGEAVSP
ncbi:MAG: polymer-forming cytoskeletal protein [Myxococcota bacterium]